MTWYVDTSALAKLVVHESQSRELVAFLGSQGDTVLTSELGRLELMRFAHRTARVDAARAVLDRLATLRISVEMWSRAADLLPATALRSLDALHLACVLVTPFVSGVVTYDARMMEAARTLGYAVASPA